MIKKIIFILVWPVMAIKYCFTSVLMWFKQSLFFFNISCRKADKLAKQTGKRYRVFWLEGRYQALTRDNLQRAKHEGRYRWEVNSTNMDKYALYDTNNSKDAINRVSTQS